MIFISQIKRITQIGKQFQSITHERLDDRDIFHFDLDGEIYEFHFMNGGFCSHPDKSSWETYLGCKTRSCNNYHGLLDYSSIVGEYVSHIYIDEYVDDIAFGHILAATFYNEEDTPLMTFEFQDYDNGCNVHLIIQHHEQSSNSTPKIIFTTNR